MNNSNVTNLAETLARTGLASSPSEAQRMAESIIGTENKVSRKFDDKNNEISHSLERKKTYNEEIEDLIQKTSMEKKNYHIMVSGYERDENQRFKEPEKVAKLPVIEKKRIDIVEELKLSIEEVHPNKTISIKSAEPVYSEILDEDRVLNKIMDEQAKEIYSIQIEKPVAQKPMEEMPIEEALEQDFKPEVLDSDDDFIVEEPKEEKRVFKNPIIEVNLMDHFNFS